MRPVIGVTLDWEESGPFAKRPYYALREAYFEMIYSAGGLPLAIPCILDAIPEYLAKISALVVPGGDFALDDNWYIKEDHVKPHKPTKRLSFDIEIIKQALAKDLAFLGICAGMQILGGVSGAKMTANINKHLGNDIVDHRSKIGADQYAHNVNVKSGTLLHKITGQNSFMVNTAHNEAIVVVAGNLIVSAVADDGAIEAIERSDKKFALGLQWHPEFFINNADPGFKVVQALIEQAF